MATTQAPRSTKGHTAEIATAFFMLGLICGVAMTGYVLNAHLHAHPTASCRLPDPHTEFRVIVQSRNTADTLDETCSIEPRNPDEGRYKTMQRIIRRHKHADNQ